MRRSLVGVVCLTLVVTSALHAQPPAKTSRAGAERRPFAALSASANEMRDSLVALARAQLGTRYVFGGTSPERGFDCSGLIKYIAQALDLSVPRTSAQQARAGIEVPKDVNRLRPGDLLTFGTGKKVSHVGIYVGDGKFIHASTGKRQVVESRIDRKPARGMKPWLGVRRLVADADSAEVAGEKAVGETNERKGKAGG